MPFFSSNEAIIHISQVAMTQMNIQFLDSRNEINVIFMAKM